MEITSIAEFSALIERRFPGSRDTAIVYRGHGAASFLLRPKVGRLYPPMNSGRSRVNETLMLELFRRQSVDRTVVITANDWELLAIAQHHGMATRLLDWTRNPLAALYFAVCRKHEAWDKEGKPLEEEAEVLVWESPKEDLTKKLPTSPFKITRSLKYIPRITTPRLRVQSGLFTAHPDPTLIFSPPRMQRIRIPYSKRKELKDSLHRHGINEGVLFPDIDGLARHIEWLQTASF